MIQEFCNDHNFYTNRAVSIINNRHTIEKEHSPLNFPLNFWITLYPQKLFNILSQGVGQRSYFLISKPSHYEILWKGAGGGENWAPLFVNTLELASKRPLQWELADHLVLWFNSKMREVDHGQAQSRWWKWNYFGGYQHKLAENTYRKGSPDLCLKIVCNLFPHRPWNL